jgi:drug/metabolite transporter (DMT)-like permease
MNKKWPKWLIVLAFIISTFLAGNNAVAVRYSNAEISPFLGGALRFSAASIILMAIVWIKHLPLPEGRAWIGTLIFGALQFGISPLMFYWSLLEVSPGMFQIILALSPMITFILAIIHQQEDFKWRTLAGCLISLAGVAIVFRDGMKAQISLLSLAAVLVGTVTISEAVVLYKSFPKSHPVTTNAIGMGVGALMLFAASQIMGETIKMPAQQSTWMALLYLIVFGSILTFVLAFVVVKYWKASIASYQLLLMPFVTMVSSSLLIGERVSSLILAGGALVLLGVYVGISSPKRSRRKSKKGIYNHDSINSKSTCT